METAVNRCLDPSSLATPAPTSPNSSPVVKVQIHLEVRVAHAIIKRGNGRRGGDSGKSQSVTTQLQEISQSEAVSQRLPDICRDARNGFSLVPVVLEENHLTHRGRLFHCRQWVGTLSSSSPRHTAGWSQHLMGLRSTGTTFSGHPWDASGHWQPEQTFSLQTRGDAPA